MYDNLESGEWTSLNPWWSAYAQSLPIARRGTSARVVGSERLVESWDEIEPWWNVFAETGHETADQISDLIEQSNNQWDNSDGPFDTDPLAADLTREQSLRGPLQPGNEMGWSQWLAQLLGQSAALGPELFDIPVGQPPNEVIREDQLSKPEGSFRRPDILVFYSDHCISIEVKLGDENYAKTAETAKLVERHYDDQDWTHMLLLPEAKKPRLDAIAEAPLRYRQNEQPQVMWEEPSPVNVIYWRDVTAAIRSVLRQGNSGDDHWAANAYLFCAVAEQQIMDFQSQPVVEDLADPANVVDRIQPIEIADTLEEQLTYIQTRTET